MTGSLELYQTTKTEESNNSIGGRNRYMRSRNRFVKNANMEKRLLGVDDLMNYLSLGKNKAMEFGKESGAVVHIGKRTLYDKVMIDRAIEDAKQLEPCEDSS